MKFLSHIRTALIFTIIMLVICGFLYPLALTGVSQIAFHDKANGSKLEIEGKVVASSLVGQDFTDKRLFHCRPSAYNYNTYTEEQKVNKEYTGIASVSNNFANSNPKLEKRIIKDIETFMKENPTVKKEDIPSDIITASGSGLDPNISIQAAAIQIDRIEKSSGLSKKQLQKMIEDNTEKKKFGIFGEDMVNVVKLNLDVAKAIGMI